MAQSHFKQDQIFEKLFKQIPERNPLNWSCQDWLQTLDILSLSEFKQNFIEGNLDSSMLYYFKQSEIYEGFKNIPKARINELIKWKNILATDYVNYIRQFSTQDSQVSMVKPNNNQQQQNQNNDVSQVFVKQNQNKSVLLQSQCTLDIFRQSDSQSSVYTKSQWINKCLPYDPINFSNYEKQEVNSIGTASQQLAMNKLILQKLDTESNFVVSNTFEIIKELKINRQNLNEQSISGSHAYIFRDNDKYCIVDEGSSNGTFLQLVKKKQLEKGDLIEIGDTLLKFDVGKFNQSGLVKVFLVQQNQQEVFLNQNNQEIKAKQTFTIGSKSDNNIQINDQQISKQHLKIECNEEGILFISDLGSMNGSWIRLSQQKKKSELFDLTDGDVIKFADIHFKVKII